MNSSKPFRRYLAEGFAIVVSILLAFAIDASWEERGQGREERRLLQALETEFRANQTQLEFRTAWHRDIEEALLALLSVATNPQSTLSSDSIDSLLGMTSWFNNQSTFEMSANDALVLSGKLSLVRNEALRQRITAWNRKVAHVTRNEAQDYDTFSEVWMPFLRDYGYLPQINNAITVQPGSGEETYGYTVPSDPNKVDHRELLRDHRFQNVLLHRLWVQTDILNAYQELEPELSSMLELLTGEIGE
jgi:hypothetical protein